MASNESSWEVEKFFNKQIRDQKRTGRGVHYRKGKGSDKAGVAGGVKFVKHNFKRYEKNSKTKASNLYENVMPYDDFQKWSEDDKIDLLIQWRLRHSDQQIIKGLGISEGKFYDIIKKYNIQRGEIIMNPQELQEAKKEPIEPHIFQNLPKEQRYLLIDVYQKELGLKKPELAKIMGVKEGSVGALKSNYKKKYDELSDHEKAVLNGEIEESEEQEDNVGEEVKEFMPSDNFFDMSGITFPEKEDKDEAKKYEKPIEETKQVESASTVQEEKQPDPEHGLYLSLKGEYKGYKAQQKLENLIAFINSSEDYDVDIVLREKKKK